EDVRRLHGSRQYPRARGPASDHGPRRRGRSRPRRRLSRAAFAVRAEPLSSRRMAETRIQLCGRFVVRLAGRRVEDELPGAKGQLLLAYLVLGRARRMARDELVEAVWGNEATVDHGPRLSVLLSKLRRVLGPERLTGRTELDLDLPPDAFVDVEAA